MREKYGWIDGLKGISILMVIVLHTNGEVLPSYLGDIAHHGGNGVQMFLIIISKTRIIILRTSLYGLARNS